MIFDQRPGSNPRGVLRGLDQKVEIQIFQNMAMLHIILKVFRYAATWFKYFARSPPPFRPPGPDPRDGSRGPN